MYLIVLHVHYFLLLVALFYSNSAVKSGEINWNYVGSCCPIYAVSVCQAPVGDSLKTQAICLKRVQAQLGKRLCSQRMTFCISGVIFATASGSPTCLLGGLNMHLNFSALLNLISLSLYLT